MGLVTVDVGARQALEERRVSLLPAGVVAATGEFDAGDAVELEDVDGEVFAKGIVRYDVETLRQHIGRRTTELPDGVSHEVIHTDDLVVLP